MIFQSTRLGRGRQARSGTARLEIGIIGLERAAEEAHHLAGNRS
jgi:hypothetical protein